MELTALLAIVRTDRERYIVERTLAGASYARIGREIGISRQRVQAIIRQLEARLARRNLRAALRTATEE